MWDSGLQEDGCRWGILVCSYYSLWDVEVVERLLLGIGVWGLGIGNWGLGIGVWELEMGMGIGDCS